MAEQLALDLFVPDRFEPLVQRAPGQLQTIIEPVNDALEFISTIHEDMRSAGRGGFLVVRGDSGTGKSTFLHTLGLFREGVEVSSLSPDSSVPESLRALRPAQCELRVIVLEEREALKDIGRKEIERDLHAINGFVRSTVGQRTLVVWPCNTDDLQERVVETAKAIGADALLGVTGGAYRFRGPQKGQYRKIAENTVATLNQGATLADLGVSDEEMSALTENARTVGHLLGQLRSTINKKKGNVNALLKKEQCKLWIIVAAGNEPDQDVAALTRGRYSAVDIERLMTSTEANIVKDLKNYPNQLGILATVLDAKVFHLPMLAALEVIRTYADDDLRAKMRKVNLADAASTLEKIKERIEKTDLGRVFQAGSQGTMARGSKPGSNTVEAFRKLASIAQSDDVGLNRALAKALVSVGFIKSFELEKDFGSGLTRRTDIVCQTDSGTIRLEIMWRAKSGRADVANYVLTKLYNYGRAIAFLPDR